MISKDKTYVTREDKFPVRIYATDGGGGNFPIHGAYLKGGEWLPNTFTEKGRYFSNGESHPLDLIEVQPEVTVWLNFYGEGDSSYAYGTKEAADCAAFRERRVACIPITYRPGDGL